MTTPIAPTKRGLLISTAIAVFAAIFVVVVVILPAEYGVDPTGIGKFTGLKAMGQAKAVAAQSNGGGEVAHSHDRKPRTVKIEIIVKPREELEYKATLTKGEPILYSWTSQAPVYFEFHGEPTEGKWPKNYYRSYEIQKSTTQAYGSFTAPFTGRHGWYWRNLGDEPITITLEVSGYFLKLGRI